MHEVFMAVQSGIYVDPLTYTLEDIKKLSEDGAYFAKEELEEILEWQFSPSNKNYDPELVVLVTEQLDNHKNIPVASFLKNFMQVQCVGLTLIDNRSAVV